jgi:hypothetical protein
MPHTRFIGLDVHKKKIATRIPDGPAGRRWGCARARSCGELLSRCGPRSDRTAPLIAGATSARVSVSGPLDLVHESVASVKGCPLFIDKTLRLRLFICFVPSR